MKWIFTAPLFNILQNVTALIYGLKFVILCVIFHIEAILINLRVRSCCLHIQTVQRDTAWTLLLGM